MMRHPPGITGINTGTMTMAEKTKKDSNDQEQLVRFIPKAKEIESVLLLSGEQRYRYFIKKVADWGQVWGLWSDGWATGTTDDGQETLPVWPAREFASLCCVREWHGFEPRLIPISDFVDRLVPQLVADGLRVAVFDTPGGHTVVLNEERLLQDIQEERSKVE